MTTSVRFGKSRQGQDTAPVLISLPDVQSAGGVLRIDSRHESNSPSEGGGEIAAADDGVAIQAVLASRNQKRSTTWWSMIGKVMVTLVVLLLILVAYRVLVRPIVDNTSDSPLLQIDAGERQASSPIVATPLDIDAADAGQSDLTNIQPPGYPDLPPRLEGAADPAAADPAAADPAAADTASASGSDGSAPSSSSVSNNASGTAPAAAAGPALAAPATGADYRYNNYPQTQHPSDMQEWLRTSMRAPGASAAPPSSQTPAGDSGNDSIYR